LLSPPASSSKLKAVGFASPVASPALFPTGAHTRSHTKATPPPALRWTTNPAACVTPNGA